MDNICVLSRLQCTLRYAYLAQRAEPQATVQHSLIPNAPVERDNQRLLFGADLGHLYTRDKFRL